MAIIGNIFLILASLVYFALISALYGKTPPRGGDAAVGYVWGIIYFNLAFFACMFLSTLFIAWKGGFDWISLNKSARYIIVIFGLLAAIITSALSGLYKYEYGPVPRILRFFSIFAPALIPAVLIITGAIMLNQQIRILVPVALYKWPLIIVSVMGVIGILSAIGGYISQSNQNIKAIKERNIQDIDENNKRMIQEVDDCDVMTNMVFILVFTDVYKDAEVKDRAVAKIKTNPNWEQELIRLLNSDWAPEAFNFLASNEVDNTDIFLEHVYNGIVIQAKLIRANIRRCSHPSHFYKDQFSWEVERVMRTVEKFNGKGKNYLPAIKEIRAALNEPSQFEKPTFNCIPYLDNWIKTHQ